MTALAAQSLLTPEEYLAFEERSFEIKHEYLAGEIWAMVGGTDRHNTVTLNLAALLKSHLRGTPCRTFMADMKLRIDEADAFFYPDVFVTCDRQDQQERLYKRRPQFIAEVVSPSTEYFDRGRKFHIYRQSQTLKEYWLIDPNEMRVDTYRRLPDDDWILHTYAAAEDAVPLRCLELELKIADVYEDVE
ncbi:Uma2 family endonuclease [Methylohalobius crimeensis]|uniref:Uma2 family endonuclease n=1 Tax=Methylohalobius crimeensis TaxID=244365 RepID=UPI0003B5164E|nr:Uma2 family endonuclease [Methylohalobius crimeensis]